VDEVIRPQEFLEAFFNALDQDGHQGMPRSIRMGLGNAAGEMKKYEH
jgi:hypothetical protein